MNFCYCFDCGMIDYALPEKGGSFNPTTACTNHPLCKRVHIFGDPNDYSPPIRNVLMKLNMGLTLNQFDMMCFKLAVIDFDELSNTKAKKS